MDSFAKRLGVNIDHVATLRQARGTRYPEPIQAALIAQDAGADGITLHLREDRRHIQDRDVEMLKELLQVPMNLEMAVDPEMIAFAKRIQPEHVCLVPEKREELTTEGGLDVVGLQSHVYEACLELQSVGIEVSLFIDPDMAQIEAALNSQAPCIELHTGRYADAIQEDVKTKELQALIAACTQAHSAGLQVNAGHGLHYHNVQSIAAIPEIVELNIGHAIIARAVFVGFGNAVTAMKNILKTDYR